MSTYYCFECEETFESEEPECPACGSSECELADDFEVPGDDLDGDAHTALESVFGPEDY